MGMKFSVGSSIRRNVMNARKVAIAFAVLIFIWQTVGLARAASEAQETPDQAFERLLDAAMKSPQKANWKELRQAFAKTTHYAPYSIDVDEKLRGFAKDLSLGKFKESEAGLIKLVERDRFMRFDSLSLLLMVYEKLEQPEKAKKYKAILGGIFGVLQYPKAGVSFENPIEVLYVQEEYLVTRNMPKEGQALAINDGHRYDIITIKENDGIPELQIYFNIDLLQNARSRTIESK
jgi:hypothetical protein